MQKPANMDALTDFIKTESAFLEKLRSVTANVIVGQEQMLDRL
ncbi:MAG: ATPase, partial [Phycisphaerae bacterium]|nr:ATPase [Saprospiraceae bacterium]